MTIALGPQGWRAVHWGFCLIAVTAGLGALVESLTGWNAFLALAEQVGVTTPWESAERFGFTRAALAFGTPIHLAIVLGLAIASILYLAQARQLRPWSAFCLLCLAVLAQVATGSRGPLLATVVMLALWLLCTGKLPHRLGALVAVLSTVAGAVALGTVLATYGWLPALPGQTPAEMVVNVGYRWELLDRMWQNRNEIDVAVYQTAGAADFVSQFKSLDAEPVFLAATRGILGLAVLTALFVGPLLAVLMRKAMTDSRVRGAGSTYVVVTTVFLLLSGTSVAFFDLVLPYVFGVVGLMWAFVVSRSPTDATARCVRGPGAAPS